MLGLQCFDVRPLVHQTSYRGAVEIPAPIELSRDLLHSKLVRVDREDLFARQVRVVRPIEEEVLDGHVGTSEISVLNLDLKLFAITNFIQTITE